MFVEMLMIFYLFINLFFLPLSLLYRHTHSSKTQSLSVFLQEQLQNPTPFFGHVLKIWKRWQIKKNDTRYKVKILSMLVAVNDPLKMKGFPDQKFQRNQSSFSSNNVEILPTWLSVCLLVCMLNPIFDDESIINKPATDDSLLLSVP